MTEENAFPPLDTLDFDVPLEIISVGSQFVNASPLEAEVLEFLNTICPIVEEVTGLSSRWSGRLLLSDEVDNDGFPLFSGRKEWNCDISLHRSRLHSARWYSTALHEMLHSVSVGLNDTDYTAYRGYEEGIVEQMTRLLLSDVLTQCDIGGQFSERAIYEPYLTAWERLRRRTKKEPLPFYSELLAVPLKQREEIVVQWMTEANPSLNAVEIMVQMSNVLGALKR